MRFQVWLCASVILLGGVHAEAQITLTGGRVAQLHNKAGADRDKAIFKFAGDPQLTTVANPTCVAGLPSQVKLGTSLEYRDAIDLPCGNWSARGSGFRYRDVSGAAGGVRQIVYKSGKLMIQLGGPQYPALSGPVTWIEATFNIGAASFCGRFTNLRRNAVELVQAVGPSLACGADVPGSTPTATPPTSAPTSTATMPPTATRTPTAVAVCGDGILQGGEECDDGNLADGDCCSAQCRYETAGSACDDGNPCTDDACDGAGICRSTNNLAGCDDGNRCTQNDRCNAGVCVGSPLAPWINEVNYDGYDLLNPLQDNEEFVEVAAPAGVDLGGYKLLAVEGAGSGSFFQPCDTGSLSPGQAYFTATIPANTRVNDDTGLGTGFLVLCFDHTSGDIQRDGKCDVVFSGMPSTTSNLPNGALSNLWDCADGVLLLDAAGNLVDAVSYEGHVANAGPYGARFVGAPNIGRDWGLATEPRRSLAKISDTLQRETNASQWLYTSTNGDSPGARNPGQTLSCYSDPGYTNTNYPIVLAHGALGFGTLFGVLDYWHGIVEALTSGGATVFVTEVSQLNSTEVRGEQLIAQIEQITAVTGKPKVNLIGHSHGGLDVRYVAAVRPDLVASVTTIAGPHAGAELADVLRDSVEQGSFTQQVLGIFGDDLGNVLALLSGTSNPNDAVAAVESLTSAGVALFNSHYPQALPSIWCGVGAPVVNGIPYFSWSGTGLNTTAGADQSDYYLGLTALVYSEASDGLVGRCSSHLGTVIRDNYFMNHLDEINQLVGLVSPLEVNPKTLFRAHANRLKNLRR